MVTSPVKLCAETAVTALVKQVKRCVATSTGCDATLALMHRDLIIHRIYYTRKQNHNVSQGVITWCRSQYMIGLCTISVKAGGTVT